MAEKKLFIDLSCYLNLVAVANNATEYMFKRRKNNKFHSMSLVLYIWWATVILCYVEFSETWNKCNVNTTQKKDWRPFRWQC